LYSLVSAYFNAGRNHQYLQQCNEVNAQIENDHVWATDGPDAIMYGLAPNYGLMVTHIEEDEESNPQISYHEYNDHCHPFE
jgi:hypothetical protein